MYLKPLFSLHKQTFPLIREVCFIFVTIFRKTYKSTKIAFLEHFGVAKVQKNLHLTIISYFFSLKITFSPFAYTSGLGIYSRKRRGM